MRAADATPVVQRCACAGPKWAKPGWPRPGTMYDPTYLGLQPAVKACGLAELVPAWPVGHAAPNTPSQCAPLQYPTISCLTPAFSQHQLFIHVVILEGGCRHQSSHCTSFGGGQSCWLATRFYVLTPLLAPFSRPPPMLCGACTSHHPRFTRHMRGLSCFLYSPATLCCPLGSSTAGH